MNFLPQNYEIPKKESDYVKLQPGENRLRILSFPLIGWVDRDDTTPVRYRFDNKPAVSIDPKKPIKHFWAMIVWNYALGKIQIWDMTQSTIKQSLGELSKDSDWGAPFHYDIKIFRSGDELKTKYVTTPIAHKPLTQEILDAFSKKPCNLDALFTNADPFGATDKITPMAIHASPPATIPSTFANRIDSGYQPIATSEHVQNARTLEAMIHPDDVEYKARILDWFKVDSFEKIPPAELMKLAPEIQEKFQKKMAEEHARKAG